MLHILLASPLPDAPLAVWLAIAGVWWLVSLLCFIGFHLSGPRPVPRSSPGGIVIDLATARAEYDRLHRTRRAA
jgi:hypothetical protein